MRISPDEEVLFEYGFIKITLTIVMTWLVMLAMVIGSYLATRKLSPGIKISRWQAMLEIIVLGIKKQIREVGLAHAEKYISFLGTLFLFLFCSNLLTILPLYEPPTSSLSTTAALAICVFVAVPLFNIREYGFIDYIKSYIKPNVFMLPLHLINEFSRTVALAIRLFGNMMSGVVILAIIVSLIPLFFPIVMSAFGLLTGTVQAYIFSILAAVFIAAHHESNNHNNHSTPETNTSS
jgi:F-type H+-transporting ATPase subunit a